MQLLGVGSPGSDGPAVKRERHQIQPGSFDLRKNKEISKNSAFIGGFYDYKYECLGASKSPTKAHLAFLIGLIVRKKIRNQSKKIYRLFLSKIVHTLVDR